MIFVLRKFLLEDRAEWHSSMTTSHWAICLMTVEYLWVMDLEVTPFYQP